jgi:ABC-type glycerol-3-phosphate transport system substrate-binding protein
MRKLSAVLLAVGLVISVAAVAEQLPAPKTEAVFPGVTKVLYAGETFVFTTTVKLSAKFEAAYPDRIQIKVKTSTMLRDGMALAPGDMVRIYWEDGDETLYNGMPPENEWIGMVLTEGGLTEK